MGRRVAVFGTGYLGATHAACMAELGHDVLGVDVDAGKLGVSLTTERIWSLSAASR
jgi:UDP-glucose 6-dehydrogenase